MRGSTLIRIHGNAIKRLDVSTTTEDKCDQRRRVAALRDNVNAPTLAILGARKRTGADIWKPENLITEIGDPITRDKSETLAILNEFLADKGLGAATKDDVYTHWLEAANTNFIGDRFMFLDAQTLKNIAARASDGFAFMNSHRTGGLSSPSELPYGRTFAGRYEESEYAGTVYRRALVGVYMMARQYPNGPMNPSTDDLHTSIENGILTDVSMGLIGGQEICDICSRNLHDEDCPHIPGTHKGLSPEQIEAQLSRTVKDGVASFTLADAMPQEVSAVFKGAVPGAGFRKAMKSLSSSSFASKFGGEVISSYGPMLAFKEKVKLGSASSHVHTKGKPIMNLRTLFGMWNAAGRPDPETIDLSDLEGINLGTAVPEAGSKGNSAKETELSRREAEIARKEADLAEKGREIALSQFKVEAATVFAPMKADGRIEVSEYDAVTSAYAFAAADDQYHPLPDVGGSKVKRTDLIKKAFEHRKPSGLMTEEIGENPVLKSGEKSLGEDTGVSENDDPTQGRLAELLGYTPAGEANLEALRKSKVAS